jgi:alpha-N-arabinofuranosidase
METYVKIIFGALLFILMYPISTSAQIEINLKPDLAKDTISRHIYGHFAEHLGRCIYDGFYVGENNEEIPNLDGVRTDIIEALKKMKIPNLRWPGGCFADTYHWKDGIGPKDKRPSMLNIWWGNITEDNSFGTNEFLNMCELLETEPYLSANVGSGTSQELADWIQYTNHPNGSSPMAKLREENGRATPWKVKYWGVGNEAWGCGGNMTPEYYSDLYRRFATFTTNWNNSDRLVRIASGASSTDYNWTEVLMKNIPKNLIEAIAIHHYSVIDWGNKGPATGFDELTYFKTMEKALMMEELIEKHTTIMDKYDPNKKVDLFVDEWGAWYDVEPGTNGAFLYQQNTMRDAMLAATTLNTFNNHADRVKMANIAQAVNVLQAVILTKGAEMILTPTYHVMEMFTVHHDAELIPIDFDNVSYRHGDEALPALSVSASRNSNSKLNLTIANIDSKKANEISLDLTGMDVKNLVGRILTSDNLSDHNTFENKNKIQAKVFSDFQLKDDLLELSVPPFTLIVITGS